MKILIISNKAPFPSNDGSSIAIGNMALGLKEEGVEVTILSLNTRKHFKSSKNLNNGFIKDENYFTVDCNTNPTYIGAFLNLFENQSYFISRFFVKEFAQKLIENIRELKPDIIQVEGLSMCVYFKAIREACTAKIVLRAHNVEYQIWQRHLLNISNLVQKWYLNLQLKRLIKFEQDIFKESDAIVAITSEDQKIIQSHTEKPTQVSLTGIDINQYEMINNENVVQNSIFHFGSMDWIPNQEAVDWFLENCWNRILEFDPNCTFVIAGKNIPNRYRKGQYKNVHVIENVEKAIDIYQKFNIMIVPLLSGSGLRIKLIEGMSYGKPIVTTSIGAEGINYTSNKELIISNDKDDFCESICNLLQNVSKRTSLSIHSHEFASTHFDIKKISRNLIAFYKQEFKLDQSLT